MTLKLYGNVLSSDTHLNLEIKNTILYGDWVKEGIFINTQCNIIANSVNYGEIVFRNFSQIGNHYKAFTNPIFFIQTLNNITIDGFVSTLFTRPNDLSTDLIMFASNSLCMVENDDNRRRYVNISNFLMTTDSNEDYISISMNFIATQYDDYMKRP